MNISNNLYRIGAVSRLTGISQDALRIWERRYQAVVPHRSEKGGRLYSEEDVARLTAIKSLVDQGHAISTVANLALSDLNQRLNHGQPVAPSVEDSEASLCLVGQAIQVKSKAHPNWPDNISLKGMYHDIHEFMDADCHCNTLIVELQYIDKQMMRTIVDTGLDTRADNIVLLYAFAPSGIVNQLQRKGFQLLREPIPFEQVLLLSVSGQVAPPVAQETWDVDEIAKQPIPQRKYSSDQLGFFSHAKSQLDCECPNHMSALIEQLVAFEKYTEQCEINSPQDAEIHGMLFHVTARARWMMEAALEKLARVEGIEPPAK